MPEREIVIQPTVLTYDRVIAAGSGPTDISANIQSGITFSAPFIVNEENQAFLTPDPQQNFSVQEQVELIGTRLLGWSSLLPFSAMVYGEPRVVERVALGPVTDPAGEVSLTSKMYFQGGCSVGTGLLADQLPDPSPA